MNASWACTKCKRRFTRRNQRHACGTGSRAEVLRNRPARIVALYGALERFAKSLGPVEFVTREHYVLLRTNRIFTDLVITPTALRIAIHLPRKAAHPLFVKVGSDRGHVSHVAKIDSREGLESLKPFLREAYEFSLAKYSRKKRERSEGPQASVPGAAAGEPRGLFSTPRPRAPRRSSST